MQMKKMVMAGLALAMMCSAGAVFAEEQPKMKAAIRALQEAKEHLQDAAGDKGGHRAKAIRLINDAIEEVQEGIRYDNRH